MSVSMEQVRQALDPDEPDYELAAMLGVGALPHLKSLINGDNRQGLASKAAYLTGLVDDDKAVAILNEAAASSDVLIRLAVASTLENVRPRIRQRLAYALVGDDDLGVRKMTLEAVTRTPGLGDVDPQLASRVSAIAGREPNAYLRQLAEEITSVQR